jgi:sugar O-acyltransferase (sialic acid O-acetyltransferase NeuD family)
LNKPALVLGAGGHAAVVVDILRKLNVNIIGLVAKGLPESNGVFDGLRCYLSDEDVLDFHYDDIVLVNAIGSLPGQDLRFKIHDKFKKLGYHFASLVSPNAIVSDYATLSEGVQVMPGAIINANSHIGEGSIINSGSIIEHDCVIGRHNHVAPGVSISGGVVTGDNVYIGTGASVIQGIHIGECSLVSAGVTVTKNLESNSALYVAKPFLR